MRYFVKVLQCALTGFACVMAIVGLIDYAAQTFGHKPLGPSAFPWFAALMAGCATWNWGLRDD